MTERHVVIVGGGPTATYALSHLAAVLPQAGVTTPVRITVVDRSRLGAGEVHSDRQARTSYMNRVAGQIAFAADESNRGAAALLPRHLRPTFHEWCRERYARTGDPDCDLQPHDVPKRYLHGVALREMFHRYADRLDALPHVAVDLHQAEVTEVVPTGGDDPAFLVHAAGLAAPLPAHHVLFATGHSHHRAADPAADRLHDPYPLEERITEANVPPGVALGLNGLGLTAIDVLLHVTEGRGGRFVRAGADGSLRYVHSGREPSTIVGVSPSGVPTSGRAVNQKVADPERLQHRAVYFTVPAIRQLRACADVLAADPAGRLDFDRHLLPLVVLEMAYVYYRTLLGDPFGTRVREAADERYRRFRDGAGPWGEAGVEHLLAPAQAVFDRAAPAALRPQRFDWRGILDPVPARVGGADPTWPARVAEFLRDDVARSARGNVDDPVKAACDGVWRDLRTEFGAAVDDGGLRPDSHRRFMRIHLRHYNRLSNGAGLEPMRKLLALVDCGLLDLSVGPDPVIRRHADGPGFELAGPATGVIREVAVLIDARVHPFDPARDRIPLYANLIRHGLVRQWRNRDGRDEPDFEPGALDLDEHYHPFDPAGAVDPRLTFLGAPADGLRLFQTSVARPHADSYVINHAVRWAEDLVAQLVSVPGPADPDAAAGRRLLAAAGGGA